MFKKYIIAIFLLSTTITVQLSGQSQERNFFIGLGYGNFIPPQNKLSHNAVKLELGYARQKDFLITMLLYSNWQSHCYNNDITINNYETMRIKISNTLSPLVGYTYFGKKGKISILGGGQLRYFYGVLPSLSSQTNTINFQPFNVVEVGLMAYSQSSFRINKKISLGMILEYCAFNRYDNTIATTIQLIHKI
jgi:hypothetical protein